MWNRWVLSRDRKTATESVEVTRSGRLFQMWVATTLPSWYVCSSQRRRMLWSTASKAADRSSSTSADRSPASIASRTSKRTFRMAISVEWWGWYADWSRGSRPDMLRWASSCRATSCSSSLDETGRLEITRYERGSVGCWDSRLTTAISLANRVFPDGCGYHSQSRTAPMLIHDKQQYVCSAKCPLPSTVCQVCGQKVNWYGLITCQVAFLLLNQLQQSIGEWTAVNIKSQ